MPILIEQDGEQQLVESLEGHDGCKVLAQDVQPPPQECCTWENGQWVVDKRALANTKRRAALTSMDRLEFFNEVMKEVDALRARVEELENGRTA